ncbi:hypothetical protein BH09PLA1_BH09PLA1_23940 [soil metagenome]
MIRLSTLRRMMVNSDWITSVIGPLNEFRQGVSG